ncbi:hypothetical protein BDV41DRAFT_575993 [Aspergillus transmontanensis]|uniref:HAT C-terminal dimerisation domain-containing protein n=1 Tax=Aspergillus transmontanensis TaxID=1034304 RepID=A0A5N6W436_9EURO|nr:hypothetical protein BDV41DRAFT_575993 [Aspergillus transmontanensis]
MSEGYLYAIATILDPMSKLEKTRKEPWIDDDIDWYQEYRHVFEKVFDLYRLHNPGVNVGSILFQMARDFLTVATNGVGVERLLNSSRDICHYRRSCLQSDTIEAIILQMCTDRLQVSEDFIVPQAEMDSEEIQIVFEQEQGNDDTLSIVYIGDIEDLDDLGSDTENGPESQNAIDEPLLPITPITQPAHDSSPTQATRSLRNQERRTGQYKE